MNKEVVTENKKEDKKYWGKFLVIIIAAFFAGAGSSFTMASLNENLFREMGNYITKFLMSISVYVSWIVAIIGTIATSVLMMKSRREYAEGNPDDEEMIRSVETKLSYACMISSGVMILIMVFIGIGTVSIIECGTRQDSIIKLLVLITGFFAALIYVTVAQMRIVNFEKEMNPEKEGSVFDMKFQEKWVGSFDEAEKWMAYKAAFSSYKIVNSLCMILCLVCLVGMIFFGMDISAICMVGIIWMASTISYAVKTLQLDKEGNSIK